MSVENLIWTGINSLLIILIPVFSKLWADKKLAKLTSSLSQEQFIHRLQFEKEFQIYQKLWKSLVKLDHSIRKLSLPVIFDVKKVIDPGIITKVEAERMEEVRKHLVDTADIINNNIPFYSEIVLKHAQEIFNLSRDQALLREYNEDSNPEFYKKAWERTSKIISIIKKVETAIRERIRNIGEAKLIE